MQKYVSSLIFLLVIFLPLSAWLVSFSGEYRLALGRDLIIILLIPVALTMLKKSSHNRFIWVILGFLVYLILSYLWKEESLAQWLRGVRFYGGPLFLGVIAYLLSAYITKSNLLKTLAWVVLGVTILGYFEYLFPGVIRYTIAEGLVRGKLENHHMAGDFFRMQGTLSGPNALGLFFVFALLTFPIYSKEYRYIKPIIYLLMLGGLVLTFSRSSYLGYLVAMIVAGIAIYPIWRRPAMAFLAFSLAVTLGMGVYSWVANDRARQESNEIRILQYERVIQNWKDVGLFGRGPGSAGLVSQYRFDDGANNYTENIYLDLFEGLGFIGLGLYILLWLAVLKELFQRKTVEYFWLGVTGIGLVVAGLFISHYTGQVALFYYWLCAGVVLGTNGSLGQEKKLR